jgi:ABC-type oligopeptide transport system substrate-binding subunit
MRPTCSTTSPAVINLLPITRTKPARFTRASPNEWAVDGADGSTIYFRIDPDARWSDGRPITTDDFVFTFYFMRSPHLNEPWYNNYYSTKYTPASPSTTR